SHAIGFYCRLTCGGSTFSIELGPSRNTSIHASETECSPGSLTLSLAERTTRSVAVDLWNATSSLRGQWLLITPARSVCAETAEECICWPRRLRRSGRRRHSHNG